MKLNDLKFEIIMYGMKNEKSLLYFEAYVTNKFTSYFSIVFKLLKNKGYHGNTKVIKSLKKFRSNMLPKNKMKRYRHVRKDLQEREILAKKRDLYILYKIIISI